MSGCSRMQPAHVGAEDRDRLDVVERLDRGRAPLVVEHRQLAEDVAGAEVGERDRAAVGVLADRAGVAGADDVAGVALVALAEDDLAGRGSCAGRRPRRRGSRSVGASVSNAGTRASSSATSRLCSRPSCGEYHTARRPSACARRRRRRRTRRPSAPSSASSAERDERPRRPRAPRRPPPRAPARRRAAPRRGVHGAAAGGAPAPCRAQDGHATVARFARRRSAASVALGRRDPRARCRQPRAERCDLAASVVARASARSSAAALGAGSAEAVGGGVEARGDVGGRPACASATWPRSLRALERLVEPGGRDAQVERATPPGRAVGDLRARDDSRPQPGRR